MIKTINALDPSQRSILEKLTSDDVPDLSLVYGPPGTGKSHLIVSLLFELAKNGKKVLFVSQNREALDVVVRKYHELDKEMALDSSDFRFLDLCLYLSESEQRRLKYIRSQASRLANGMTQISWKVKPNQSDDDLPYPITYRNFGDDEEGKADDQVGLDELLTCELEFVKNDKIAPKVINDISNINIREVCSLLRNYRKPENFKRYNHPNDELRFFSNSNMSLILGDIRVAANAIKETLESNPLLLDITAWKDADIDDYIQSVKLWAQGNECFNVSRLCADKVSVRDIEKDIYKVVELYKKIPDCELSDIPRTFEESIFNTECDEIFKKSKNADELKEKYENAEAAIKAIEELGNDIGFNYDISEIINALLYKLDISFLDELSIYKNYKSDEMEELSQYSSYWDSLSSIKQTFATVPTIFNSDDKALIKKTICKNADYYKTIANILSGTKMTFGELWKDCRKAKKASNTIALRYGEDRLVKTLNAAYKLNELFVDIFPGDILLDDASIGTIRSILLRQVKEGRYVSKVLGSDNTLTVQDAIKVINSGIKKRKLLKDISGIEESIKEYIKAKGNESFIDYCKRYTDEDYLDVNKLDKSLLNYRAEIDLEKADIDKMSVLQKAVLDAKEKQYFAVDFFKVNAGEKVRLWLDRVQYAINFFNVEDFNDFVEHNRFISNIKDKLGASNAKLIDEYIDMDLDFADFAEQIVHSLKFTIYGNMAPAWVKTIDDGFFDDYKKELNDDRKKYYLQNIRSMAIKYEPAARRLISPQNWHLSANTTMAKIRANSDIISDAFPVIIATPAEVAKYIAPRKELFDFVIFDEASQLLPGQAIPSIYRAKSAVIVGDPHQMPPISTAAIGSSAVVTANDDEEIEDDQTSILDVVKDMQIEDVYHLKVHYRSKYNVLFEPSRKAIYANDDIRPIVEAESTSMPLFIEDNIGEDNDAGYSEIIRRANGYIAQNPDATFCILFTRKDKKGGGEDGFREYLEAHGSEARALLRKYDNEELLISTVTNCQGIMGDHTILYIPHYAAPKSMWFFKEAAGAYRRLNVAVTRQAESLDIIMGDDRSRWMNVCQDLLSSSQTGPNALKSAELLQTLLTNAGQEIGELYLEKTLGPNKDNIDSPLTRQLYEKLCDYYSGRLNNELKIWCEVGYKIRIPNKDSIEQNEYNVGYRIDIGIYSMYSKKFILGIEMDGATYHSGFYKEFSDAQRQDILESKGWNIYRIWSTNWLHDTKKEFNALVNEIDNILKKEKEKGLGTASAPVALRVNDGGESNKKSFTTDFSGLVNGFMAYRKKVLGLTEEEIKEEESISSDPVEHIAPHNPYSIISYRQQFIDYTKRCIRLGKPVDIKYTDIVDGNAEELAKKMPYQRMFIKAITDEFIEARFDTGSSYYRINIDKVIAYIEE